jgi:RimJ/RimL family protein N-acetyltransferase
MRGWGEGDLDAVASWTSDPEVMRFLGGVQDRNQTWRSIAVYLGHWQLRGHGLWAVERRSDQRVIGRVGISNPEGWPGAEVGWTFHRDVWGQGYATECGAAASAWGWANLPEISRLLSIIAPENRGSRKVAERLGMEVVGTWMIPVLGDLEALLYGIDRPVDKA